MKDQPVSPQTAFLFASNTGVAANTTRFNFTGSALQPIYDASYLWKINPVQQSGYYTTFFWGNNGNFYWDSGAPNSYYGGHPYPDSPPSGSTHKWEISVDGGDDRDDENGHDTSVDYGRDHWQMFTAEDLGGGGKRHRFYWDLLAGVDRYIEVTVSSSYGNTAPPSPVLTFGDAPWSPGNESLSGKIWNLMTFTSVKTPAQALALLALTSDAAVLAHAAAANLWYCNISQTLADISDKSGNGHHPAWHNANRPTQVAA